MEPSQNQNDLMEQIRQRELEEIKRTRTSRAAAVAAPPQAAPSPEAMPMEQAEMPQPESEEMGVGGYIWDALSAVPKGIVGAARDVVSLPYMPMQIGFDLPEIPDYFGMFEAPKTTVGSIVDTLSGFATGYGAVAKGLGLVGRGTTLGIRAAKAARAAEVAAVQRFGAAGGRAAAAGRAFVETSAKSAITSGLVFDGNEARLSNLLREEAGFTDPITEYLAASDEDSELEGRLKNMIEDFLLGGVAEIGIQAVKASARVATNQLRIHRAGVKAKLAGGNPDEAVLREMGLISQEQAVAISRAMNTTLDESETVLQMIDATGAPRENFVFMTRTETEDLLRSRGVNPDELAKEAAGFATMGNAGKVMIGGFQGADLDTAIHEVAHGIRMMVVDPTVANKILMKGDIDILADISGASRNADGTVSWSPEAEENFVDMFTEYLATGVAASKSTRRTFSKLTGWVREMYAANKVELDARMAPEVRQAFNNLMNNGVEGALNAPGRIVDKAEILTQARQARRFDPKAALPADAKALENLLDEEEWASIRSPGTLNRMVETYRRFEKEILPLFRAAAETGAAVQGGYEAGSETVEQLVGRTGKELFAMFSAATSPQTKVAIHTRLGVGIAADVVSRIRAGNLADFTFEEMEAIVKDTQQRMSIPGMSEGSAKRSAAVANELMSRLRAAQEANPGMSPTDLLNQVDTAGLYRTMAGTAMEKGAGKVPGFAEGSAGRLSKVVLDTYMARILPDEMFPGLTGKALFNAKKNWLGNPANYTAMSAIVRKLAGEMKILPGQAQERIWGSIYVIAALKRMGVPDDKIFKNLANEDMIASWDLLSILKSPEVTNELRRLGATEEALADIDGVAAAIGSRVRTLKDQPIQVSDAGAFERLAGRVPRATGSAGTEVVAARKARGAQILLQSREARAAAVNPQVTTPEFKSWFKQSKVADESGAPLVAFHATKAARDFSKFQVTKDLGYHFTLDPQAASRALSTRMGGESQKGGARIYPAYLSIQNPLRVSETGTPMLGDFGGWDFGDLVNQFTRQVRMGESNLFRYVPEANEFNVPEGMDLTEAMRTRSVTRPEPRAGTIDMTPLEYVQKTYEDIRAKHGSLPKKKQNQLALQQFVKDIKAAGYDGIVYSNAVEGGGDSYIAFDSTQIKSATGNVGTFSPTDPNILRQARAARQFTTTPGSPGLGTPAGRRGEPKTTINFARFSTEQEANETVKETLESYLDDIASEPPLELAEQVRRAQPAVDELNAALGMQDFGRLDSYITESGEKAGVIRDVSYRIMAARQVMADAGSFAARIAKRHAEASQEEMYDFLRAMQIVKRYGYEVKVQMREIARALGAQRAVYVPDPDFKIPPMLPREATQVPPQGVVQPPAQAAPGAPSTMPVEAPTVPQVPSGAAAPTPGPSGAPGPVMGATPPAGAVAEGAVPAAAEAAPAVAPEVAAKTRAQFILDAGGEQAVRARMRKVAMAEASGNPLAVTKLSRMDRFGNVLTEYFMNSILSGPATHVVNIFGNLLVSTYLPVEKALGASIRGIAGGMGPSESLRMAGNHLKPYVHMYHAFIDSFTFAGAAFRADRNILENVSTVEFKPRAISASNLGMAEGTLAAQAVNWLGTILNIPTRVLSSTDEFFKQINYRAALMTELEMEGMQRFGGDAVQAALWAKETAERMITEGQAYSEKVVMQKAMMEADKAVTAGSIQPNERSAFIARFMADSNNWDEDLGVLSDRAMDYSRYATFTTPLTVGEGGRISRVSARIQQLAEESTIVRFVMPFIRTPTRILEFALDRTIPGQASNLRDAFGNLKGQLTDPRRTVRDEAMGRVAFAVMSTYGLFHLIHAGGITGDGPSNPTERDAWLQAGNQPYSIKFGDKWISYRRLDPFASMMGLVVDTVESYSNATERQRPQMQSVVNAIIVGLANNFTNKSYLTGVSSLLEAIKDPERYGDKLVYQYVSATVPFSSALRQAKAGFADDLVVRDIRSMLDAVRNTVPGAATAVMPRRNMFGEPVERAQGWGPDIFSPITYTTVKDDLIMKELDLIGHSFDSPREVRNGMDLSAIVGKSGQTAYDRWLELHGSVKVGGKTLRQAMTRTIRSRPYQMMSPETTDMYESPRVRALRTLVEKYRAAAFKQLMREFPEVDQGVNRDFATKRALKTGRPVQELMSLANR